MNQPASDQMHLQALPQNAIHTKAGQMQFDYRLANVFDLRMDVSDLRTTLYSQTYEEGTLEIRDPCQ